MSGQNQDGHAKCPQTQALAAGAASAPCSSRTVYINRMCTSVTCAGRRARTQQRAAVIGGLVELPA